MSPLLVAHRAAAAAQQGQLSKCKAIRLTTLTQQSPLICRSPPSMVRPFNKGRFRGLGTTDCELLQVSLNENRLKLVCEVGLTACRVAWLVPFQAEFHP